MVINNSQTVGTVISAINSPNPSSADFVVTSGLIHRGQFVEIENPSGNFIALVMDVYKTNKYFERADSVKEFESKGQALFEQFPVHEWEYLVANTKPLGVYSGDNFYRPSFPPSPGSKVRIADSEKLKKFFHFDESGLHLGNVEYHDLSVKLNLSRMLKKHLAILAMSGSGKCGDYNLEILLSNGRTIKLGELVDNHLKNKKVIEDNVEVCDVNPNNLKVISIGKDNQPITSEIKAFMRRKAPKKMFRIRTRTGKQLLITPEHPIPILNEQINWIQAKNLAKKDYLITTMPLIEGSEQIIDFVQLWKNSSKVRVDDELILAELKSKLFEKYSIKEFSKIINMTPQKLQYLLSHSGVPLDYLKLICNKLGVDFLEICSKIKTLKVLSSRIPAKVIVDEKFARFMAYLLAEGHNSGQTIIFTNSSTLIREDFSNLTKLFGVTASINRKRDIELRIYNKLLADSLFKLGFTDSSWTKYIPEEILLSKKSVLAAFLGAFIDCDGYVSSKKSHIEITLASKQMLDNIEQIVLRFKLNPIRKIKTVKGKQYGRLFLGGADYLTILNNELTLLIDYKAKALKECSLKKPNSNIRVIPNIKHTLAFLQNKLNLTQSQFVNIANYLSREERHDDPTPTSLKSLLNEFEHNYESIQSTLAQTKKLFYAMPNLTEEDAKKILVDAYSKYDFNKIAKNTNISSTTARRVVRGLTEPNLNTFCLAKNALALENESDLGIDVITNLDFKQLASQIRVLCKNIGCEIQELCNRSGFNDQYLDGYSYNPLNTIRYSNIYKVLYNLFIISLDKEKQLPEIREKLDFLHTLISDSLFFDAIESVEEVDYDKEYVYDLCVKEHNFVANNLIIHNSFSTACLIEELLNRQKEKGRIAIVVLDPHGEYSSFAQPVKDGKYEDFSDRTKIIKAQNIRIAVPKMSVHMLSGIIPGLTIPQKRDLSRILSSLKEDMYRGLGPFDWSHVKDAILKDDNIKQNSKFPLMGWIDDLMSYNLFARTDMPAVSELIKPGTLTILDFSDIVNMKKKQMIVSYFANKLFDERKSNVIPPTLLIVEEAHQWCPQMASEESAISRSILRTIAREGRKFGMSLCIISQRPVQLDTTTLSQCSTHLILRITNPNDLKHIAESSEGIDQRSFGIINSLQVGEGLLVGEATGYPLFFKVRYRKSMPSKHEISLEDAALKFESSADKTKAETEGFLE
ncbi:MAG: DUF87 domain-containing protein [archaeon]